MQKSITAVAMAILVMTGFTNAWAEMVDIGLGRMEKSEFVALKAMVTEGRPRTVQTISTPLKQVERYGPVEMSSTEFQALKDKVAGIADAGDATPIVTTAVKTVGIGTGEMPVDEFRALKRMVEGSRVFGFGQMAAVQP